MPSEDERPNIKYRVESSPRKISSIQLEMQHPIDLLKEHRAALITAAVTGQITLEEMRP
jgi:type I restriction enzyme S subunit